jgi:hypothetical protein
MSDQEFHHDHDPDELFLLMTHEEQLLTLFQKLNKIERYVKDMSDALSGIAADEAALATSVPALITALDNAQTALATAQAALAAQIALGTPVDPSELASIQSGLDAAVSEAAAALNVAPVVPTPPAAPVYYDVVPAPADASVFTVADVVDSAGDPLYTLNDGAVLPSDGSAVEYDGVTTPAGGVTPVEGATLYSYSGPDPIDPTVWTLSTTTQGADGTPLYTYSGDINPGDANGSTQAGWAVFSAATVSI